MVGVTGTGTVFSWGYNSQGQCGHPPPNFVATPTFIRPILGKVQSSITHNYTLTIFIPLSEFHFQNSIIALSYFQYHLIVL